MHVVEWVAVVKVGSRSRGTYSMYVIGTKFSMSRIKACSDPLLAIPLLRRCTHAYSIAVEAGELCHIYSGIGDWP